MCSARTIMEEADSMAEHWQRSEGSSSPQHLKQHGGSTADIPLHQKETAAKRDAPSVLSSPAKKRKLDQQLDGDVEEIQDDKKRLACPFFKRKPTKTRLSCVYPGFSSIARLKEHLYRQHMLPQHLCSRCLGTFKSETELREHSRAPEPCQVDTETYIEGITLEQEKALKSKKRTSKSGINSNEEKWRDIYSILFPNEKIPSAFCDTVSSSPLSEEILRQELPDLVKAEIQKNKGLLDHSKTFLDILSRCLEQTFSRLHHSTFEGQLGATHTTTETSLLGPIESVGDADGEARTPKGNENSAHDPISPRSTVSMVESTRNDPMSDISAPSDPQAEQGVKNEGGG